MIYNCFHYIFDFDHKWSSILISKASNKPHTIFLSLPVKDCLFIDIVEIIALKITVLVKIHLNNPFDQWKSYFKLCILTKATNNFSKITLKKRSNGLYNVVHHNLFPA